MTATARSHEWRDPWPSSQPSWQDPPWLLSGRVVTAWFDAPWAMVEASISADLYPEPNETVPTRLRFYDLSFEVATPDSRKLAPSTGTFRECSLGFAARAHGVTGEISAFLWSDSPVYTMWAREAFGWPVAPAAIELDGEVWTGKSCAGQTGSAMMTDAFGTASLEDITTSPDPAGVGSPGAVWLTPRRILNHGTPATDDREILIVKPRTLTAGQRFRGSARVSVEFPRVHPLESIPDTTAAVEAVDGIVLLVGDDLEVLR